ncbi:hypothetical protein KBY71_09595 [Cyanobium sp. T1B-Tous]|uniref:hypothetical protein n=1 Tax=Cyanobium sp. T1B-Tous TaxID=2823721 RepID=UPI0020CC4E33|nr:hypothetical protein [Cyanobium sp. T1B-Tous]MCP9806766.1 hypothetical protein [Cyanobium sp. T1B-Tous]
MLHSLAFVLARDGQLPGEGLGWTDLVAAQGQGPDTGRALRLFRLPDHWQGSLDDLVATGCATIRGDDPLPAAASERRSLICDAVVPLLEVSSIWIGVYALRGPAWPEGQAPRPLEGPPLQVQHVQLLDRFPLAEAANETCWFYPTDNGSYLCWENRTHVTLLPGWLPEQGVQQSPISYDRGDVHVLWSLMADDEALTCVGLTYQRRRIEWPLGSRTPEPSATWTCFEVDTMADPSYVERARIDVFPQ